MIEKVIQEIKLYLKRNSPYLTDEKKSRMYKILNSDNPNFKAYGIKHSDIEKFIRQLDNKYQLNYETVSDIFKVLIKSDLHDEKMACIFLLNRFKKNFTKETIEMIQDFIPDNFDTWAITDTTMIRVIGPFLGKKGNEDLARETIAKWSISDNLWLRRASLVILLKLVMINKDFDEDYVFGFVKKMLKYPEDYIHKGIGWLLKTCSKFNPKIIYRYLLRNKTKLPRLILRYGSEKLSKENRLEILSR
ncbi:MAG: DNA alkylation repair protein [Candidatus Thorarchaeota archaeon]